MPHAAKPLRLLPLPPLHAASQDGQPEGYPLNPELPRYQRVPILTVGDFHPCGVPTWTVDKPLLESFAANYDPFFYPATANCDHNDWYGPACAVITRLYVEGDTLYADLGNVDWWTARELDEGKWPQRSVEWWQESILGEKFYGKFDNYITGLGFLGVDSPAVPGLGPMPPRAATSELPEEEMELVIAYVNLLAARAVHARASHLISTKEEPVPPAPKDEKHGSTTNSSQAPEGAGDATELAKKLAAAEAENATLRARQTEAPAGDEVTRTLTARLERIEAENAQFRARDREREIDTRAAARLADGTLTVAMVDVYKSLAAKLQGAIGVRLSASQEVSFPTEAGEHPLDLVDKLLAAAPKVPMNVYGAPEQGRPGGMVRAADGSAAGQVVAALRKSGYGELADEMASGNFSPNGKPAGGEGGTA